HLPPLPPGARPARQRAQRVRTGPLRGAPAGAEPGRSHPCAFRRLRPGHDDAHRAAAGGAGTRRGTCLMAAEGGTLPGAPSGATVLVGEDEANLAAGLKLNLELDGYRVVLARSIREADAQLLQSAPIDLVLLDVMLPDGDGYSFCKQLRESGHFMPVIMLTARSAAEDRVLGLDSGADDYMPKPFQLPELLARVRSALRRSGWRQAADATTERRLGTLRFGEAVID